MCLWVRPEGWLGRSAHPLGGAERRGHAQCPALAPNTKLSLLFTQSGLSGLLFATLCDPRDCSTAGFPPCPSLSPRVGCSKVAVGFLVSLYLWVQNLPQLHMCSYFQSHTVSLYFVAGREVCPGASIAALQQRVPGPSLSQSQW